MIARVKDRLLARLRAMLRPAAVERDMQDEMRAHLQQAEERLMARGLSPAAARAAARREFGNVGVIQEEARDARGGRALLDTVADLRYALRALAHAPAFAISAALVLALGIGASITAFSAVRAVVLDHLPYPNDEQLVRVFLERSPTRRIWTLSAVDLKALGSARSFAAAGAMRGRVVAVSRGSDVERLQAGYIDAGFLDALGVPLAAGRRFGAADEERSAPATVVLGHAYAERAFGSPEAAVGQLVTIDGEPHRVIGVLRAADARLAGRAADVWPILRLATPTRRGPFGLFAIARLAPGVSLATARHELADISIRIFPEWQSSFQDAGARLTPYELRETMVGNARRPLALFSAAVALVLLIAVTNVASLAVVRCMRRWRELALRSVLGASRARLVRLVIMESIVVAGIGGVLGLALAVLGTGLLRRISVAIPRLDGAHLDASSIGVAAVVSLLAGVAIGFVPALRLFGDERRNALGDGSRSTTDGRQSDRVRSALVAAEFALALPVLSAGALLLVSVARLQRVDPGYDVRGVLTTTISLPSTAYRDQGSLGGFWTNLLVVIEKQPGVAGAALGTANLPNDFGDSNENFDLADAPVPPGGAQPTVSWLAVSRGFFQAMRVPLLSGRLFTASDTGGARPLAVVTRSWAAHYSRDRSPLGRELIVGGCTSCPHTVVIGVVGDVTIDGLGAPGEAVFSPLAEGWPGELHLFVRAVAPASMVMRRVREVVRSANPLAAASPMSTLDDDIYESVAAPRNWAAILAAFAVAGLVIAAVGIFGLLSYTVAQRRRDIGIRVALGAPAPRVVADIVAHGMRWAALGAGAGLALSLLSAQWLRGSLYEVSAFDPRMLFAVTSGLLLVGLVAAWIPARRAALIDPLEAMR